MSEAKNLNSPEILRFAQDDGKRLIAHPYIEMSHSTTPLRYVVLRHEGIPQPHFDFMIETSPGAPLATWRAEHWPPQAGETLERLSDHRQAYLAYEGPVSDDRGHVHRIASGLCTVKGIDSDEWTIHFDDADTHEHAPRPARFSGRVLRLRQSASDSNLWQVQS